MRLKIVKELIIFSLVVATAVVIFATGHTVGRMQEEMVNQEAYFYGMSHILKSSNEETIISTDTDFLDSQAYFWGVHLD